MSYVTTQLGDESGIQYQGVSDKTNINQTIPMTNMLLLVENVPHGRLDQPMTVTHSNKNAILGHEKDNLYLQAVEDALKTNVPSIQVMRVLSSNSSEVLISATYDYFYQTITVQGDAGLSVNTKDPNGNVIGSSVIGADGSVTYSIDEGMLLGGTVISTSAVGSNIVNHNLVASFIFEAKGLPNYPNFGLFGNYYADWLTEDLPNTMQGEIIVEPSGFPKYTLNLTDLYWAIRTRRWFDAQGYMGNTWRDMPNPEGADIQFKIRFRNLSQHIYIDVYNADHIQKFFDDGTSNIGYCLSPKTYENTQFPLKQIPTYLPKSLVNLNCMFLGDEEFPVIEDPAVIATLANWDTSHVLTTNSTFYGRVYNGELPVNTMDWSSLVDASFMFFNNPLINQPITMSIPNCETVEAMLGSATTFNNVVTLNNSSKVKTVKSMYSGCLALNSKLFMDSSNVTDFSYLYDRCSNYNQSFDHLNMISGINFTGMLQNCSKYNQPIVMNTPNAQILRSMLAYCSLFNSTISINTTKVTDMNSMLRSTTVFNQPITFTTSSLTGTDSLVNFLNGNAVFNQDLSHFDMKNIPAFPAGFIQGGEFYSNLDPWNHPIWGYTPIANQPDVYFIKNGVQESRYAAKADGYILRGRFIDIDCERLWFNDNVVGLMGEVFNNAKITEFVLPPRDFKFTYTQEGFEHANSLGVINTAELTIAEGQVYLPSFEDINQDTQILQRSNPHLTRIVLPSTLAHLNGCFFGTLDGGTGFYNCIEMICHAVVPPQMYPASREERYVLRPFGHPDFKLRVPAASVAAYKAHPYWGNGNNDSANRIIAI